MDAEERKFLITYLTKYARPNGDRGRPRAERMGRGGGYRDMDTPRSHPVYRFTDPVEAEWGPNLWRRRLRWRIPFPTYERLSQTRLSIAWIMKNHRLHSGDDFCVFIRLKPPTWSFFRFYASNYKSMKQPSWKAKQDLRIVVELFFLKRHVVVIRFLIDPCLRGSSFNANIPVLYGNHDQECGDQNARNNPHLRTHTYTLLWFIVWESHMNIHYV